MTKVDKILMQRIAVWNDRKSDYRDRLYNHDMSEVDYEKIVAVCDIVLKELNYIKSNYKN